MRVLEAAVKAIVAHAVAIAVAGLLMEYVGDLGRQFVGMRLKRILGVRTPQIRLGQDRWQLCPFWWWPGVVGWNAASLLRCGPLRRD